MKKHYLTLLLLIVCSTVSAQLVLTETLYDPASGTAGDSNRDGDTDIFDDEFIELVNTGAANLDISGYKFYDLEQFNLLPTTDEPTHEVPAGTILAPGGIFVVFGGTVNDLDTDLVTIQTAFPSVIFQTASGGRLDLQNGGDDIYIFDSNGDEVLNFKSDDLMLNMGVNSSVTRKNSISDPNFVRHTLVEKAIYSPGKLVYSTVSDNSPLVLNEFLMDPGTSDTNGDGTVSNSEDEFLEFVNTSGASLDISGFKITDEGGYLGDAPRHIIPSGTIIPNNGVFLLFGGGTPDGTRGGTIPNGNFGGSVFQASSTNTLNLGNSGDVIYILDASDTVIFAYDSNDAGLLEGDNQSITRSPDVTGSFVHHTTTPNGEPNSPGFKIDGTTLSIDDSFFYDKNVIIYKANNNILKISGLEQEQVDIQIFNILGKEILHKSFASNENKEVVLPVISKGLYIVSIFSGSHKMSRKIILK